MSVHPESSVSDVLHYLNSWAEENGKNTWGKLIELIQQAQKNNPYLSGSDSMTHNQSLMWMEQNGINFPMMYVASVLLYKYGQKYGCDTYLFATRDCCHWVKIFKKMFPNVNAYYFHCSRNMLTKAANEHNKYYQQYVKSLMKSTVDKVMYIDIHGTCQRILQYFDTEFNHQLPHCFLLSSSYRAYDQFPRICREAQNTKKLLNLVFDARGTPIEMLNFDTMGTIQDFDKHGPIRDPPEYSLQWLESYHVCINYMVNLTTPFKENIDKIDTNKLSGLIRRIYRVIQDNLPVLIEYVKHPGKH